MKPVTAAALAGALASSLWLAGCAGPLGFAGTGGSAPPFRDPGMSMQTAMQAVVIGQSTKADVLAVLGTATEIPFDSGYEVWVYRSNRLKSEAVHPEFAILFAPSGVVTKTRIRPAYTGRDW